jgi:CHAD domain-containing protein
MTKVIVGQKIKDRHAQIAAGAVAASGGGVASAARADRAILSAHETSRSYRLRRSETPAEGIRRIAAGRVENATERLRETPRHDNPSKCVHAARKEMKKVRALLRLVRDEIGEGAYRAENGAYKMAGRLLSESRDAEIKVQTLEDICDRNTLEPGAAAEWLDALRGERQLVIERLRDEDGSAALEESLALLEAARERIGSWSLEGKRFELVGPGIEHAFRRGRKRLRRAVAQPTPENLHEWRKRVKDLWYHLRILEGPASRGMGDRIEGSDRLADALGDHHDLVVLRDDLVVRELPTVARSKLVAAISTRQEELAAQAFKLGEALYAEKPKRFRKQLRAAWRAWRKG